MIMNENSTTPPICYVSQASCYKPVCLLEGYNSIQIWAMFAWKNETTLKSVVFSPLDGDQQVVSADFDKSGTLRISLGEAKESLKIFNLNVALIKDQEYPCIIDFSTAITHAKSDGHNLEDPTIGGSTVIRNKP
jgi:hypothetical protein